MTGTTITARTVEVVDPNGEGTATAVEITVTVPPTDWEALETLGFFWGELGDVLRSVKDGSS